MFRADTCVLGGRSDPGLAPPLPTETIIGGRYRIVRVKGRGSFGITYQAMDGELGRVVAVKEYFPRRCARRDADTSRVIAEPPGNPAFEDGRIRLKREGRTLAGLRHDGIVRVFDVVEANGTLYLVMEYIDGAPLSTVPRERLPATEIASIAREMLSALAALHAMDLVHCDVKPDNVMVETAGGADGPGGSGRRVLIDFGSVKRRRSAGGVLATAETLGPETVPVAAAPDYIAPELLAANPEITPQADLYALAGSLHELATGRRPPPAVDRLAATGAGRPDPYRPLAKRAPSDFPPGLAVAIDAGLALPAKHRPASAKAMLRLLDGADDDFRGTVPPPPPETAGRPWLATLALAALAAGPVAGIPELPGPMAAAMVLALAGVAVLGARGRIGTVDTVLAIAAALGAAVIGPPLLTSIPEAAGPLAAFPPTMRDTVGIAALSGCGAGLLRWWPVAVRRLGALPGFLAVLPGLAGLTVFVPRWTGGAPESWSYALDQLGGLAADLGVTAAHLWTWQGVGLALVTLSARSGR